MGTRREFIGTGLTGIAALSLLPAVNTFATVNNDYNRYSKARPKLRFALASDIHYGQTGTDYTANTGNMVQWINVDHAKNHLDMVIINGDLVHNRPDLLSEIKTNYLDKLSMPYHTIPGNHDFADADVWQKNFGYEDKYTIEFGDIAFVLANTADNKGTYICPDNAFIKASLDKLANKKIVFVILHIPPLNWVKADVFVDCPETVNLLHSYPNVKAVFHGHDHMLDGVRYTGKLPHFFDSHIGGDWGTDYKGYRIVEVDDQNAIYTYQVNASQNPVLNSTKF
ncbi:metallophosphoesterase family protein [Mucilaginibacter sp. SP1R1]|uniref:metallophosphoesterase family protein n=1 Tax=Mucilaginibacter sp. SP1R1 TaxID=2723091 RepID=UPI001615BF6C|nr:metallophosphoesterase [Mucilaginibacter sp. SP1R1]MBB6147507.1 3',5'-cyclic AMP phosphodiesterase CpdA [Mucilaginibacter sp. SP1R1]